MFDVNVRRVAHSLIFCVCTYAAKRLDSDLFPWLLEEFPYLHLAPATLHNLWRKESLQLEQLSRAEAEVKRKKSKAQEQVRGFRLQFTYKSLR